LATRLEDVPEAAVALAGEADVTPELSPQADTTQAKTSAVKTGDRR
jgi:hypothetical protein